MTSTQLDVLSLGSRLPESLRSDDPVLWDTERGIFVDRSAGLTATVIRAARTAPLQLSLQEGTGFVSLQVNYGRCWAESTVVARPRKAPAPPNGVTADYELGNLFVFVLAEPVTHRIEVMRMVGLDFAFARGVRAALRRVADGSPQLSQQQLESSLAAYFRRYADAKAAADDAPLRFTTSRN